MSYYGGWCAGDDYRAKGEIVVTSNAAASVSFKAVTYVESQYGYDGYGSTSADANAYGGTVRSVSGQSFGDWSTKKLVESAVRTVSRTHSSQTIQCSGYVSSYAGQSSWYGNVTVAALASYTVTYNANGGTGTTSAQTKWYGEALTLRSNSFTRANYVFKCWNTKADGTGTSYSAGGTYTGNAALTLYAIWYAPYSVTYNANGGSGTVAAQTKVYNSPLTLRSNSFTRAGYTFAGWATSAAGAVAYAAGASYTKNASVTLYAVWSPVTYAVAYAANAPGGATVTGLPAAQSKKHGTALTLSGTTPTCVGYTFLKWNTKADGTGTAYAAGGTYTANAALTLYAQWRADAPTLVVPEAYRSDALGAADDEGAYATVTARWTQADETLGGSVTITATVRSRGADPSPDDPTTSVIQTGTSGSASVTVGAGTLTQDDAYTITVTATNALGTTTVVADVGTAWYPIDVKAGGHGIAIGGVAHDDGLSVNMDERVNGNLDVGGRLGVGGRLSLGDGSTTTEAAVYGKLASRNAAAIRLIDYDVNGSAVLIGDGGLTVVGGGESASALYNALINAGSASGGTEQLHLASDNALYLHSNCNSIGSRHTAVLETGGGFTNEGIIQVKSSNVTSNTTPSSAATGAGYFRFLDSAGTSLGFIVPYFPTSGNQYLRFQVQRVVSGSTKAHRFNLGIDASGEAIFSVEGTGAAMAWKKGLNVCMSTAIFTGKNVSNGGTIGTYTDVFDYRLFWVQLSGASQNWCLCYRIGDTSTAGYIRGVGALDNASNSYVFKTNISVSTAGVLKVVASSQHILNTTVGGTTLYVSALYGIK